MKNNKIYSKAVYLLFFLFISINRVLADDMTVGKITEAATGKGDDLSRKALVTIFGDIVNNIFGGNGSDTLISSFIVVINLALLLIGIIWAVYQGVRKLAQTAHDGQVFDRQSTLMWGPVKFAVGIISLVPLPSGWSFAQLIMLWAGSVLGVGLANIGTDRVVDAIGDGISMTQRPLNADTRKLAVDMFEVLLCKEATNATIDYFTQKTGLSGNFSKVEVVNTAPNSKIVKSTGTLCGTITTPSDTALANAYLKALVPSFEIPTDGVYQAHQSATDNMLNTLSKTAQTFVSEYFNKRVNPNQSITPLEQQIVSAARAYENSIQAANNQLNSSTNSLESQLRNEIKEKGWWMLGSWYQTFAEANTKINTIANKRTTIGKINTLGEIPDKDVYAGIIGAYQQNINNSTHVDPVTGETSIPKSDNDVMKVLHLMFDMKDLTKFIISADNEQVNPLIKLKTMGDYILGVSETGIVAYVATKGIAAGFNESAYGWFLNKVTGIAKGIEKALDAVSPFLIMLLIILFMLGISFSIYLPLIPFIVWFGAIINWLVVVGEAILGAPLWALAHLGSEGEGMGERSKHGYLFLLNMICRPLLMVGGFLLGGAILIAGGTTLIFLFSRALDNAQTDSITGIVSLFGFLYVFYSMSLTLITSSFSLINVVPDQVINWIGGHASAHLGKDIEEKERRNFALGSNKVEGHADRGGSRHLSNVKDKKSSLAANLGKNGVA